MNKEYIYTDGRILVTDDKGRINFRKNYENIDKLLFQENIVEELEDRIKEFEEKTGALKDTIKPKKAITNAIAKGVSYPVTAFLIVGAFSNEPIKSVFIYSSGAIFLLTVFEEILKSKEKIKDYKAYSLILEKIKPMLEIEKNKLEEIKENAKISEEIPASTVESVSSPNNSELTNLYNLYFTLASKYKKYYKQYQKNNMKYFTDRKFTKFEIDEMSKLFEEKGPRLSI